MRYGSSNGRRRSSSPSPVEERPAACVTVANATPRPRIAARAPQSNAKPAEGASNAAGGPATAVHTSHSANGSGTCAYWIGRPCRADRPTPRPPSRGTATRAGAGGSADTRRSPGAAPARSGRRPPGGVAAVGPPCASDSRPRRTRRRKTDEPLPGRASRGRRAAPRWSGRWAHVAPSSWPARWRRRWRPRGRRGAEVDQRGPAGVDDLPAGIDHQEPG